MTPPHPAPPNAEVLPATRLAAFWHVWAVHHWREIVTTQARLLAGFPGEIHVSFIGSERDSHLLLWLAQWHRLDLRIATRTEDPKVYESPALRLLEAHCNANPEGFTLYFHSKGVSKPNEEAAFFWRGLMNHYMLTEWPRCVADLATHDVVCTVWVAFGRNGQCSHSQGNFFWVRNDYIPTLWPFPSYFADPWFNWRGWGADGKRLGCEFWIGSHNDTPRAQPRRIASRVPFRLLGNNPFSQYPHDQKHLAIHSL